MIVDKGYQEKDEYFTRNDFEDYLTSEGEVILWYFNCSNISVFVGVFTNFYKNFLGEGI